MSPKPGVERRHRFRRLEDVHPGGGHGMRVAATRAESNRVRQARGRMAVASLALVTVGAAACLLVLGLAGEAGLDPLAYLIFVAVIPLAWLVCLPAVDRLAFALACAPRRPRRRVVRALRRALDRDELELHFQPQVELETGRPTSVEALLRWRHQGELSLPARFLADAESSEIIGPLTNHVLELAFAQAGQWRRSGRELGLSVNLSATALRDFSVVDRIEALLEQHGVAAETITLEVTETAVLHDPELARAVLDALSDLGVSISIDDFGTGYSSLLWLRLFPVDQVKIDRSFIAGSDDDGEAFIAGVISLGHSLHLGVVAEGVEDEHMVRRLQELGCDTAQGWHFADALPAAELEEWLDDKANVWEPEREEMQVSSENPRLREARDLIEKTASGLGYDADAIWDMKLAATEALVNAIEHGVPGEDGLVHLRLARKRGDLVVEVWGGGAEDSKQIHHGDDNRGRGIAIMTALMDEVELKRNPEASRILLAKRGPTPD